MVVFLRMSETKAMEVQLGYLRQRTGYCFGWTESSPIAIAGSLEGLVGESETGNPILRGTCVQAVNLFGCFTWCFYHLCFMYFVGNIGRKNRVDILTCWDFFPMRYKKDLYKTRTESEESKELMPSCSRWGIPFCWSCWPRHRSEAEQQRQSSSELRRQQQLQLQSAEQMREAKRDSTKIVISGRVGRVGKILD